MPMQAFVDWSILFLLDVPIPPNQIHHNGNDREHEKKVNPSTQRIRSNHAKNPEDHENNRDCP